MTVGDAPAEAGELPDAPARAGWRQWLGLAVLCLPTMLAAVDVNVMFLALPDVTSDLGINATEQLWVIDVYGFMITGFLITMGKLVDRVGRRKVLLVVPPAAASAAGESLAGATAAADPLPAPVADALLDAARAAFTSGFNVVAGIAAVAFAGLAVLATAGLRYTPAIGAGSSRGPLPGRYASLGIRRQTRMVGAGRC